MMFADKCKSEQELRNMPNTRAVIIKLGLKPANGKYLRRRRS